MLSRTPRIGPALALALFALALATAIPASAGVGYRVTIERPEPEGPSATARGTVVVRAGVEGGVGDAEFAAYHVRPPGGSWSQASSLRMQKVGDRFFAAEEEPWETTSLVNGEYELEVRVWGDPALPARRSRDLRVADAGGARRQPAAGADRARGERRGSVLPAHLVSGRHRRAGGFPRLPDLAGPGPNLPGRPERLRGHRGHGGDIVCER